MAVGRTNVHRRGEYRKPDAQRIGHLSFTGDDANESNPPYAKTYVYLAGVRLYNRMLSIDEIKSLATEFSPSERTVMALY